MRRFTRRTNAFSKKVQKHEARVAIYAVHYHFARVHKRLGITPGGAAGLTDQVSSLEEIALKADHYKPKPGKRGPTGRELHRPLPRLRMKVAMRSSWQTETGHLTCRWSEIGQGVRYHEAWIEDTLESGYVPPVTDFASHSPFGGASWFLPHTASRDSP
jgi:hypothetical protein